jgi:hypothetical protein
MRCQRGKWSERAVRETETYSTCLLPDFTLDLAAVFDAAQG